MFVYFTSSHRGISSRPTAPQILYPPFSSIEILSYLQLADYLINHVVYCGKSRLRGRKVFYWNIPEIKIIVVPK